MLTRFIDVCQNVWSKYLPGHQRELQIPPPPPATALHRDWTLRVGIVVHGTTGTLIDQCCSCCHVDDLGCLCCEIAAEKYNAVVQTFFFTITTFHQPARRSSCNRLGGLDQGTDSGIGGYGGDIASSRKV